MTLQEELQKFIKGEVKDDEKTLEKYSRDYSIFKVKPLVVVFPKDEEDIKKLVVFVNKHPKRNLTITARSAGTDMSGGPLTESIVLDFTKYFNKIKKIGKDPGLSGVEGYAIVQPGVYYRDF